MKQRVLIWDLPTRFFHWLLVMNFFGAYFSGESERWALIHITCGFSVFGLIIFRLIWGLVGTRYARFTEFMRSPAKTIAYIKLSVQGHAKPYIGHNPAGAMAILCLLSLGIINCVSGWLLYEDIGWEWLETLHEQAALLMLVVVILHVLGVLVSGRLHRENLIHAMLDGRKYADEQQAISNKHPLPAYLILISLAAFWVWSFKDVLAI